MPNKQQVNVDLIGRNGGQGDVAKHLAVNGRMDLGRMRPWMGSDGKAYATVYLGGNPKRRESYRTIPLNTNATLRRDEWKQLDEAILPIKDYRLGGVQDLISAGLTYNLGNAMGTTVLEHHTVSDAMEAELSMDGVSRSKGDRPNYETVYTPIPIIHVDYEINARVLAASRSLGNPLDTTSAERAARKVNEKLESMLFTSSDDYAFGGGNIYSYISYPHRNTGTFTAWGASAKTAAGILQDVKDMCQASRNARYLGPWVLYIPAEYQTYLDDDYDTSTPGTTVRERILKIGGLQDIKVSDTLATGNLVLVQMTRDVVRLIRGMGLQNVEWMTEGNMITKYKVMTIQVPQIRADQDGRCGVTHYSTS